MSLANSARASAAKNKPKSLNTISIEGRLNRIMPAKVVAARIDE